MKSFVGVLILFFLVSCNRDKAIVNENFIDSLLTHYSEPAIISANQKEIEFWKARIDPENTGIVNELKYAGSLVMRFQLAGDIYDIKTADSILKKADKDFNHKEASPYLALIRLNILQHRFKEADSLLVLAKKVGLKKYEQYATSFDVNFELGRYALAANDLRNFANANDYGYFFRRSKMDHYKGHLDSAANAMLKAASLSGSNNFLRQAALSNAADIYIHAGELQKAYDLYTESIRLNAADLHSIMNIGWISLIHDKNDSLAEKVFQFVRSKTKSPDALLKLIRVAEARGDSASAKQYAEEFSGIVTDSLYGNMYNKYLIELYTGILNDPSRAEGIAKKELGNRATPQTYAWYVWALYSNNKKDEALSNYQKFVSGKPLESLELYWMGKFMQGSNKGYNAREYFKAANKNKYDLSLNEIADLEKILN